MIRIWIAYAVGMSLLLVMLLGVALGLAFQQPASDWTTLLHLSDCELPCWIGIEPGKTSLAAAQRQIEAVYGNSSFYQLETEGYRFLVVDKTTAYSLGVLLDSGDDQASSQPERLVQTIYLSPGLTQGTSVIRPTMGDLSGDLGNVEALRLLTELGDHILFMFYREQQVEVQSFHPSACNKVLPTQPVDEILLGAQTYRQGLYLDFLSDALPWHGFQRCYSF